MLGKLAVLPLTSDLDPLAPRSLTLMDVLLISTNRNRLPMPVLPLGGCMVAEAAERAGHRVRLLDLMFQRRPLQAVEAEIRRRSPDVVGLSIRNIDNNDMQAPVFFLAELPPLLALIRRLTKVPVVLGGAAVSVMPEEILRFTGADCGVRGAGETVFPELIENLRENTIPRDLPGLIWFERRRFRTNPPATAVGSRECPAPAFERWLDLKSYRRELAALPLQTKLGCHFQCIYCTYPKIEGSAYRLLAPASALGAVRKFTRLGIRDVEVVDNVFNSPYAHALQTCEVLAGQKHRGRLQSLELNPGLVDDGLLTAMRKAGFRGIGITVESASDRVLTTLRKGFSAATVQQAADTVTRHRLPCLWIFMLGGPGETESTIRETLLFAKYFIRPRDIAFFNLGIRIYPGTGLERIARKQKVLRKRSAEMLEPVFYFSPEVGADWVAREVRKAMDQQLNFIDSGSIGFSWLPAIQRFSHRLGLRPPLWRYSRQIRRGLRLFGAEP